MDRREQRNREPETLDTKISLEVGKKYYVTDGCGMVVHEALFIGPAYAIYDGWQGEQQDWRVGLLVFDLGEREGHYRYAGVAHPEVGLVNDGVEVRLYARHYGHSVEALRSHTEPRRVVRWSLDK